MQQILRTRTCQSLKRLAIAAAAALTLGALPASVAAQSPFAPAITVNDDVITYFEIDQRALFLAALNSPGDPLKMAREELIKDALKLQAIEAAGMSTTPENVTLAMEEFASRGNLTLDQLVSALEEQGVAQETLRDFAKIGLLWRDYVQSRFLNSARPSQDEINRALGQAGSGGGIRVLLSEIIIPMDPQNTEQVQALAADISLSSSFDEFSDFATRYSASGSRADGGRLEWLPINDLPGALRPVILALSPGEVSEPIQIPNAVALFQMRDVQEIVGAGPRYSTIDYAVYRIPGGRSPEAQATAARVAARVDVCDDLYGVAKEQPAEVLSRESLPPAKIPRDIALELAKLDPGEISTTLTAANGQNLLFVMLCSRTAASTENASREDVANALTQARLEALANSFLEQQRANALISEE